MILNQHPLTSVLSPGWCIDRGDREHPYEDMVDTLKLWHDHTLEGGDHAMAGGYQGVVEMGVRHASAPERV
jgi:hypothetical protein